jgi:hypothetical protein
LLSIPLNKLPCLPDKKPTVFVREHSLKLQQSWSRISAGNKCIWACSFYSILIVFCLFFLCLIVYYTTYHCLLHTYLLLMYLTKNIIKSYELIWTFSTIYSIRFKFVWSFYFWLFDVHVVDFLLDFLLTSTHWKCIGNINSAQNWIKRWVAFVLAVVITTTYAFVPFHVSTKKAIHHIQQQILKSHYTNFWTNDKNTTRNSMLDLVNSL